MDGNHCENKPAHETGISFNEESAKKTHREVDHPEEISNESTFAILLSAGIFFFLLILIAWSIADGFFETNYPW